MDKKSETESSSPADSTRRRRKRYSAQEKLRLLSEAEQPGSSVSEVGRKYGHLTQRPLPLAKASCARRPIVISKIGTS